jgi:hypothetical protein
MGQKLHDTFRVCMGTETHIVDLHLDVHDFIVNGYLFLTRKNPVSDCARHAITRNDDGVFLGSGPLFECLQTKTTVKHTRGCEENHGLVCFELTLIVLAHVREIEHVLFNESFLYLFVCPVDKQFVVEICFFCETTRKINRVLEARTAPVRL